MCLKIWDTIVILILNNMVNFLMYGISTLRFWLWLLIGIVHSVILTMKVEFHRKFVKQFSIILYILPPICKILHLTFVYQEHFWGLWDVSVVEKSCYSPRKLELAPRHTWWFITIFTSSSRESNAPSIFYGTRPAHCVQTYVQAKYSYTLKIKKNFWKKFQSNFSKTYNTYYPEAYKML